MHDNIIKINVCMLGDLYYSQFLVVVQNFLVQTSVCEILNGKLCTCIGLNLDKRTVQWFLTETLIQREILH